MSNDNKTLADVQPGGRVRLGDQAERARFEEWLATQHDQGSEHVMATVSDTDDRYQSPVTSSMWSAWQAANAAREGGRINGWRVIDGVRVYSAYAHASILDDQQYVRYEDYLAALSAQPSPGGQGALPPMPPCRDRQPDDMPGYMESALDWVRDVDNCDAVDWLIDNHTAIRAALAARQPVSAEDWSRSMAAKEAGQYVGAGAHGVPDEPAARQPVEFERAIPTRRRESAVELLLQLGFVWNNQRWEDRRQPVGELHLPPDGFYKIVFDDAEVPDESFARSGALDAALRRFEQISNKWNAHLFVRFANNSRDCTVPNAKPAQAVDLGRARASIQSLLNWIDDWAETPEESGIDAIEAEAEAVLALIDSQAVGK